MTDSGTHYDVIVIGSGFGGSVAAMRAAEKGYRVAVMESGKRWPDDKIAKTSWNMRKFLCQPAGRHSFACCVIGFFANAPMAALLA